MGVVVVEEPPIYLFVVVVQLMVYKEHSFFLVDAFDDLALELELELESVGTLDAEETGVNDIGDDT